MHKKLVIMDLKNIKPKRIVDGIINTIKGDYNLERLKVCNSCEHKKTLLGVDRCNLCGCQIHFKCNSVNECCPANKWHDIKRSQYPGGILVKSELVVLQNDTFLVSGESVRFVNDYNCDVLIIFSNIENTQSLRERAFIPKGQFFEVTIRKTDEIVKFQFEIFLLNSNNTDVLQKNKFKVEFR